MATWKIEGARRADRQWQELRCNDIKNRSGWVVVRARLMREGDIVQTMAEGGSGKLGLHAMHA